MPFNFTKKILFSVSFVTASVVAYSQHASIGPELGVGMSSLRMSYPNLTYKNRLSTNFRIGLLVDIPLGENLSLQTGPGYHTKACDIFVKTNTNLYYASHIGINALQLPLYLNLQSKPGSFSSFFAGAGGFFDYHLSAKEFVANNSTNLIFGKDQDADLKHYDFGVCVQAGCIINSGFTFRAQYQFGFANLSPHTFETIKSQEIAISIAYIGNRTPRIKAKK